MSDRNINKIIEEFFNFDLPCPTEVPMCEKVREAYKTELDAPQNQGCSQCRKNGIKNKYLQEIWKEAVQSITSKASSSP